MRLIILTCLLLLSVRLAGAARDMDSYPSSYSYSSSCMPSAARVDCGYGDQNSCEQHNCCWTPVQSSLTANLSSYELTAPPAHLLKGTPWCYGKQRIVGGYAVTSVTPNDPSMNPGWLIELALYDGSGYFGTDIPSLNVSVTFESEARLRVKIVDAKQKRWEIPEDLLPLTPPTASIKVDDCNYEFSYTVKPFGFAVTRKEDGEVIFNTSVPTPLLDGTPLFNGLVFTDQYIEISTQLPNQPSLYGLGEQVTSLQLRTQGRPITFWARDAPDPPDLNIYGSHPYYLENRQTMSGAPSQLTTKSHGVWLRNSNGMDVLIHDSQHAKRVFAQHNGLDEIDLIDNEQQWGYLTYRVIGGVLDFFIYTGAGATSRPEQMIREYHKSIGFPHMPPLHTLGFHQCRWGYSDLAAVQTVVERYAQAKIPLDNMWNDIDYMDAYEDFTTDPVNYPTEAFSDFIKQLNKQGQHFIVIVDPGIHNRSGYEAFEVGLQEDVFVKQQSGDIFIGQVWPGYTAFPSWFGSNTQQWWTNQIVKFRQQLPVEGLWIDMNEAANFCTGDCSTPSFTGPKHVTSSRHRRGHSNVNQLVSTQSVHQRQLEFDPNNPPYRINNCGDGSPLNTRTIDMDAVHGQGFLEYNVHNLFGLGESIATRNALESSMQTRSFVLSRSTFSGSGTHVAHWLGDNWSTYESMAYSITGVIAMNMFGIPLVGPDICGFNGNTTEELCARWMALGAFYPFSRNHNSEHQLSQEPYMWDSVTEVSKLALGARYSLIHMYNTLFFKANQIGGTVARPLFYQFSNDVNTWSINTQFMIGDSILITPALTQGATTVNAYLPPKTDSGSRQAWFNWWTYAPYDVPASGQMTFDAPLSTIPVHVCGGSIIPIQTPALTIAGQLSNPFTLLVAQNYDGTATGSLFMDDGLTLQVGSQSLQTEFTYASGKLTYSVVADGYAPAQGNKLIFEEIIVLLVPTPPSDVLINGKSTDTFTHDPAASTLKINVDLPINQPFTVVIKQ